MLIALTSWLILVWTSSSFRLKRSLLNLATSTRDVQDESVRSSFTRTGGAYLLEARLFSSLGMRAPREFLTDLSVLAVFAFVVAALAIDILIGGGVALGLTLRAGRSASHMACARGSCARLTHHRREIEPERGLKP